MQTICCKTQMVRVMKDEIFINGFTEHVGDQ